MQQRSIIVEKVYLYSKGYALSVLIGRSVYLLMLLTVLWLSVALADYVFYFSSATRWGLWFINLGIILFLFFKYTYYPAGQLFSITPNADLTNYARQLGKRLSVSHKDDEIVNAYHLITRSSDGISRELRDAAVRQIGQKLTNENLKETIQWKNQFPDIRIWVPLIIAALSFLFFMPGEIFHSTLRLLNPANEYLIVPAYSFKVIPGSARGIRGEDIIIKAKYEGPSVAGFNLLMMSEEGHAGTRVLPMEIGEDTLRIILKKNRSSFMYRIAAIPFNKPAWEGKISSALYQYRMVTRPAIQNLDVEINPPVYSGLTTQRLDRNVGDFFALPGSRISVRIESDKILKKANLVLDEDRDKFLAMKGKGKIFKCSFMLYRSGNYHFSIHDSSGLSNDNPISYRINLLTDASPFVEITEPGKDMETSLDASLKIRAEVSDDYGVGPVFLMHRILRQSDLYTDTIWVKEPLKPLAAERHQQEFEYNWDFAQLPLTFDDAVEYFVMAFDNRPGAPGRGSSKKFTVRFPSLDDIFAETDRQQEEQSGQLHELVKQTENLRENLQKLNRELKRENKLDWEQKQQVENVLNKQKELQKQLEDIQRELEETIERLEKNSAISDAVLEKYKQVLDLFEEIATPELRQAIQELQQAMAENNTTKTKRALERMELSQEAFQKQLDRTYELFKKAQLEQKLDQLVQISKDLTEQEKKIHEDLKSQLAEDANKRAQIEKNQRKIAQRTDRLEKKVDQVSREPRLNEFKETQNQLQKAVQLLSEEAFKEKLNDFQKMSEQEKSEQQIHSSGQLAEQYEQVEQALTEARNSMMQQNKNAIEEKMKNLLGKMLTLSHEQERLEEKTKKTSPLGEELQEMTRRQGEIMDNFQRMVSQVVELSNETFYIDRELGKSLGNTQKQMLSSLAQLSERNTQGAARSQLEAMKQLNLSSKQMQSSLQSLSKSQSGLGMDKFMEQMKKMAGAQGQLNGQTMSLLPKPGGQGGMGMEQRAAMRRIAAEQNALREMLEELGQQMGDRRDIAGRMGNMARQMDEVIKDLVQNNVSRKTIERQRQILSRMLDAQKSMTARKKSKKRQAEQAKQYAAKDPLHLGKTVDERKEFLQSALKKAKAEGYSADYQKLIEQYFKTLMNDQKDTPR